MASMMEPGNRLVLLARPNGNEASRGFLRFFFIIFETFSAESSCIQ